MEEMNNVEVLENEVVFEEVDSQEEPKNETSDAAVNGIAALITGGIAIGIVGTIAVKKMWAKHKAKKAVKKQDFEVYEGEESEEDVDDADFKEVEDSKK